MGAGALPAGVPDAAFAPIERLCADTAGLGNVERLLLFVPDHLPARGHPHQDGPSLDVQQPGGALAVPRPRPCGLCAWPADPDEAPWPTAQYVLRQVARRYLPAEIVNRPKHGFAVPIGRYIRTLFRERCRDTLLSRSNPVADWFRHAEIEAMLDAHLSGRADFGKRLWSLYVLFTVAARQGKTASRPLAS